MIIKKDSEIVKPKGERRSLSLKAKNESSDEECSTSEVKTKIRHATKTIEHSLEVLRAIAVKKMMKRSKAKHA
ncbi:hypothetical protein Tco_1525514 [Tanacetum coccineum]